VGWGSWREVEDKLESIEGSSKGFSMKRIVV
jgi:hypothetical protein